LRKSPQILKRHPAAERRLEKHFPLAVPLLPDAIGAIEALDDFES